jgi:hypothetical protein
LREDLGDVANLALSMENKFSHNLRLYNKWIGYEGYNREMKPEAGGHGDNSAVQGARLPRFTTYIYSKSSTSIDILARFGYLIG